ncbi:CLUMA_CG018808, isoform A [Clunio marinus]|uniref:CLUMA_CG018808, isoform A n=1 Tax=Clunio marinus TaxID=568069 RepID=A0A1J1J1Z2_9DIPT|nr:CLUMA_CG018808, isoform A [Clunio marinus]
MTLKVYIFILSQFLLIEKISSGGDPVCENDCGQINPLINQFYAILNSARDDLSNAEGVIFDVLGKSAYQQARALAVQLRNAETQEDKDNLKTLLAEITYDSNNGENKEAMEEAISGIQDKLDELTAMLDVFGNLKKPDCSQCDGVPGLINQAVFVISSEKFKLDILQNIVEYTTPL